MGVIKMSNANSLYELLSEASLDKSQDVNKIDVAWYKLTEKAPIPIPEEMRQDLFCILLSNYDKGHYTVAYNPQENNKKKKKRHKK